MKPTRNTVGLDTGVGLISQGEGTPPAGDLRVSVCFSVSTKALPFKTNKGLGLAREDVNYLLT